MTSKKYALKGLNLLVYIRPTRCYQAQIFDNLIINLNNQAFRFFIITVLHKLLSLLFYNKNKDCGFQYLLT